MGVEPKMNKAPEKTLTDYQAELALLNKKDGWIACLQWLNARCYISPDVCDRAREAMQEELG